MSVTTKRHCGGTRFRLGYGYSTEELDLERLEYYGKHHEVRGDQGFPGTEGERPLFARRAPVIWCPTCDGTGELEAGDEQWNGQCP